MKLNALANAEINLKIKWAYKTNKTPLIERKQNISKVQEQLSETRKHVMHYRVWIIDNWKN